MSTKTITKSLWQKMHKFAEATTITGVVKQDHAGNLWEWVSSGKRVTIRQTSISRLPQEALN